MENLEQKYDAVLSECAELFGKKLQDYGATWLLYRDISIIDQLWIKAKRIVSLEEFEQNGDKAQVNDIGDSRADEFIGIINYATVMLMRIYFPDKLPTPNDIMNNAELMETINADEVMPLYKQAQQKVRALMLRKNHDYGSAWEGMHQSSITDQIIIKIYRIKNIVKNGGRLLASEGIDAQLSDIINYCVFNLIKAQM